MPDLCHITIQFGITPYNLVQLGKVGKTLDRQGICLCSAGLLKRAQTHWQGRTLPLSYSRKLLIDNDISVFQYFCFYRLCHV